MAKQELNFLPKSKFWNGIEVKKGVKLEGVEHIGTPEFEGHLVFDSSTHKFMGSYPNGEGGYAYLPFDVNAIHTVTIDTANAAPGRTNTDPLSGENITLYISPNYFQHLDPSTSENIPASPIATIADCQASTIHGATMNGVDIVDNYIVTLVSDTSYAYSNPTNPLATVGTVTAAIDKLKSETANHISVAKMDNMSIVYADTVTDTSYIQLHSDSSSPYAWEETEGGKKNPLATRESVGKQIDEALDASIDASAAANSNKYFTKIVLSGTIDNITMDTSTADIPVTDVQVNGSTIISNGVANIVTSDPTGNPYDPTDNPLATQGDIEDAITGLSGAMHWYGEAKDDHTSMTNYLGVFLDPSTYYVEVSAAKVDDGWKPGDVIYIGTQEYVCNAESDGTNPATWQKFGDEQSWGVHSIGGLQGDVLLGTSFATSSNTINLNPASTTVLGGIKVGNNDSVVTVDDVSVAHTYDVSIVANAMDSRSNTAFIQLPYASDSNDGILSSEQYSSIVNGATSAHIYKAIINPTTITNYYSSTSEVTITHNLGTSDVMVDVYANMASGGQRQKVYVDSIVTDASTITVGFGTSEAFMGCQVKSDDTYLGYTVVFTATEGLDASTCTVSGNGQAS